MNLVTGTYASPLGTITFALANGALAALDFAEPSPDLDARLTRRFRCSPRAEEALGGPMRERLGRYFEGDIRAFDDLSIDADGTPFQKQVWAALREIPPGETRAYGDIAARIGAPSAVRAVGAANGKNPIALVVPCHRVIGRDGTLTGYAGGLWRKRWLLDHERGRAMFPAAPGL